MKKDIEVINHRPFLKVRLAYKILYKNQVNDSKYLCFFAFPHAVHSSFF